MIRRIVHLTIDPGCLDLFLDIFECSKADIRAFPGCRDLVLLQDIQFPNLVTTLSTWDDEASLEAYRKSSLFTETWAKTKPLLAASSFVVSTTD